MLKLVSFHIQAHLNAFLQILEYFSQSVDVDDLNLLAYSVFEFFDCARGPIKNLYSIQIPATVENSMDLPRDLDWSIDLHLPVLRIAASRQLWIECRVSENVYSRTQRVSRS